ncbi:MAG TPA: RIO1 family regulatory kinase/ATPase [Acidimicrobiales bacterium]|nr:RIO1 family regulatory kinase/ATPase [Acidimicrobiales bacterium]
MHQHDPERAAPAWLTAGGTDDEVLGLLKTGKEAEVFVVERRTLDGRHAAVLAHKRYRPTRVTTKGALEAEGFSRARTFTDDAAYRAGRTFAVSRDRRAVARRSAYGRRVLAEGWSRDEFDALSRAHRAGVTVPYPVEFTGDGTLMQFVGDGGVAAPRLVAARLTPPELATAHAQVMDDLAALTRIGLVHADLSPYNLLWWRGRAWIIDFPQAVDLVVNPNGFDMLHHDVTTVCGWFARKGVACDGEATFAALLAEAW